MTNKPLNAKAELLKMRLAQIQQLPIPEAAKDRLASIVTANADPEKGEGLDFALKHISKERLAIVTETAKQIHAVGRTVVNRGSASLAALSDAEWQALVDKANE